MNGKKRLWLLFILAVGLTACGRGTEYGTDGEETVEVKERTQLCIVCHLDEVNEKITLQSLNGDKELVLNYNGGSDVKNQYGAIMPISQIQVGSVVDIGYDAGKEKLLSMYVSGSDAVQKFEGVTGVTVDHVKDTIAFNGRSYRLREQAKAFSDNKEVEWNNILPEDQLSIWVYNDVVCSVYVELGHGYVKLSDYASYMGGTVEIGYDVIVPVTDDMNLTVREGTYTLRIAKGDDVGTKTVEVLKNQQVDISLADIAVEPKQVGSVLFHVTPSDAKVYIDKVRVNTEGAVDIVYGKHRIDIIADGYESYSASFNVKYAYKVKEYTLKKKEDATESSTKTRTAAATQQRTTQSTTEAASSHEETTEHAGTEASTEAQTTEQATMQ